MLDVSQLQAIDPLRNGNHFDVCESMRRVLISMEKKINDRHLDVEADIPDEPILVLGDNDMITQVIYNLLENAAKFAREEMCIRDSGGVALVIICGIIFLGGVQRPVSYTHLDVYKRQAAG